jgi:hypothetical protein
LPDVARCALPAFYDDYDVKGFSLKSFHPPAVSMMSRNGVSLDIIETALYCTPGAKARSSPLHLGGLVLFFKRTLHDSVLGLGKTF